MSAQDAAIGFDWRLSDIPKPDGPSYVSTFSCGGGSSMGYRLAGYRPLGFVEVDARMVKLYHKNLGRGDDCIGDIRKLTEDTSLIPSSWNNVDVLDGSPPCTVFSAARGKSGPSGVKRKYAEGAITQSLDDLFEAYLNLVGVIRPKVFIAENVVGMTAPKNRWYLAQIDEHVKRLGYHLRVLKLNAASRGLPQLRKRLIFIGSISARDVSISLPSRRVVTPRQALHRVGNSRAGNQKLSRLLAARWASTKLGGRIEGGSFSMNRLDPDRPCAALCASRVGPAHWSEPRYMTYDECARLQSFPDDYDFMDQCGQYVCGMSVPPFMMRDIALAVRRIYF